jgi:Sulfotransferase family
MKNEGAITNEERVSRAVLPEEKNPGATRVAKFNSSNGQTCAPPKRLPRWGGVMTRRLCPIDVRQLCRTARRNTGLEDFGDPPIEQPLSELARSLESEADLHPLGRFLMHVHLRDLLETRLRLAALWHSQSEALAASPIERPIFITGMPRSGSTFLHELLAEDPGNRAPRVWEVMFPLPESRVRRRWRDARIARASACLWWFRRLAPKADAVYPMRARTPHECVAMHSYSFLSEEFISTCRVPSYEAFLRNSDLRPAYAWERRLLQHFQLGRPARRWVLKSPDHAQSLEELFAIFPDALIVQTHRNPLEVLNSACQLTHVLHRLYGTPGTHEEVMHHESRVLAEGLRRLIRFRDAHPELEDRFVDVRYQDVVADPLAVIRQVYQRFRLPLSEVAARRMRQLAGTRARYPKPRTGSALRELGSHAAAELVRFEHYCARFGISSQRPQLP